MTDYKQIKISVNPALAKAFKDACQSAGVSMAGEIAGFMAKRAAFLERQCPCSRLATRGGRRKELAQIIQRIEAVRLAEEAYMDNIPSNLQDGPAYESASETIDALDEAVQRLGEAF